jgi:hypothetical protein
MRIGMEDATNHVIEANGTSTNLLFKTAGATRMTLGSTGNLNITGGGTFGGVVLVDGLSNYTGLEVKGAGGSRPMIQWSNANNGDLCAIYGTESNEMVLTSGSSNTERIRIESDGFLKLAGGNGFGSLHNTGQNVTSTFANYFDFSDLAVGGGQERGMYLVALSRNGGSVGSRLLAFIGISTNQTVYVYEILASAVLSIQGSGSNLQVKHASTGTQSIQGTAIPVAIDHN